MDTAAPPIGWVDLALGGVLLLSILVGLLRGFVFEVLSLAGWFVAYFAAQWLAPSLAPRLPIGPPGSPLNHGAAFAAGFLATLLLWAVASRLLRALLHATPLSVPDRLLGGGFGMLRGALIVLAVATLVGLTPAASSATWQQSRIARWAAIAIDGLKPLLPPSIERFLPRRGSPPAAAGAARGA